MREERVMEGLEKNHKRKIFWAIGGIVALVLFFVVADMVVGINHAGNRTVIQYPSGTLVVKFSPGIYFQWFGSTTEYRDIVTYDFDKEGKDAAGVVHQKEGDQTSLRQNGIPVRYQDGGTGTIFGKARFSLPNDELTMVALHKAFRSHDGVSHKLIKPIAEESANLTAGLMTSEEAYTEKRGTFIEWSREQVQSGRYRTKLEQRYDQEEITGRRLLRNVPVIDYGPDGRPQHLDNDLKIYGISVTGYQITDWGFEPKTLEQIATKREATMGIITAKANADRAQQDAITSEAQGKKNVTVAKYEKEVDKERAVVDARREAEVAVIAAQREVDVAEKQKLEAEQKKLAAVQYKQEQILRGEGDAERKRLVIEADGALEQKLATYTVVMGKFAEEFSKQKWVPEVSMGGGGSSGENRGNEAANLIGLLTAKTLRDLGLDMSVPQGATTKRR